MSRRSLIWMMLVVALGSLTLYLAGRQGEPIDLRDEAVEQLAPAIRAYKVLQREGYRPLSAGRACRGAIAGMLEQVDEFCQYIPPEQADRLERRLGGVCEETGLRIATGEGRWWVAGVLPGSPAASLALTRGEEVLSVGEWTPATADVAEVREALRGPTARPLAVVLAVSDGAPRRLELSAGRFDIQSVVGLARDAAGRVITALDETDGIHYLRISEFVDATPEQLHALYRTLRPLQGLVLDLRGNPGGSLTAAIEVADRFLPGGLVVRTVSRDGARNSYWAHDDGTYPAIPVAVLVDGRTASAAEIVAGALAAHDRAVLVGRRTRGKWAVMRTVDLGEGLGRMYLAVGEYFLPEPATAPASAAGTTAPAPPTAPSATTCATRPALEARPGVCPALAVALPPETACWLAGQWEAAALLAGPAPASTAWRPGGAAIVREHLDRDRQLDAAVTVVRELLSARRAGSGPAASSGAGDGPP